MKLFAFQDALYRNIIALVGAGRVGSKPAQIICNMTRRISKFVQTMFGAFNQHANPTVTEFVFISPQRAGCKFTANYFVVGHSSKLVNEPAPTRMLLVYAFISREEII